MRKHVKPADPGAVIQDLERGKRLPPEGASVAWTAYYAKLVARGDIIVVEPADAGEPAAPEEPQPVADPDRASQVEAAAPADVEDQP
ncbi:hypothetical protein MFUR16E_04720 [Methylobacterium fujisawaense]|uniref:DUF2635 domain-containing protein n=1 Tax=Methylobacterium fujisawaense TaxID=107400 RepID=UPI002F2F455F